MQKILRLTLFISIAFSGFLSEARALDKLFTDTFGSDFGHWNVTEGGTHISVNDGSLIMDPASTSRTLTAAGVTDFHSGAIRLLFLPFNNGDHDNKVYYPNESLQLYLRYAGPTDYTLLTLKPYNDTHIGYYVKTPGMIGDGTRFGYLEWGNTYDNKWLDALITARGTTLTVSMRGTPYDSATDTFTVDEWNYRGKYAFDSITTNSGTIRISSSLNSEHPLYVGEVSVGRTWTDKKVYAVYHPFRYSRPVNGKLGLWKWSASTENSAVTPNYVNYNADLIDENGLAQIASFSHPETGVQSSTDPDYLEYQILLAKAAHIDGFMTDWNFPENEANDTLLAMISVAERLDFEVGVDWTDGNALAWLPYQGPQISDREQQIDHMKTSFQYLLDNLYSSECGAHYAGHPFALLFGAGFTAAEFQEVRDHSYTLPAGKLSPWFFKWSSIGAVSPGSAEMQYTRSNFHDLMNGPFGWTTPMLREDPVHYPYWDEYALTEDCVEYVQTQVQSFLDYAMDFDLNVSSVSPGFDNRSCASWAAWSLSYMDRDAGEVYRMMWEENVANKDWVDAIIIATWNDFTENTQIQPTVEMGYRELEATETYGALFKDIDPDPSGLELPYRLFKLRKAKEKMDAIGLDTTSLHALTEEAVTRAAALSFDTAENQLLLAEAEYNRLCEDLTTQSFSLNLTHSGISHDISAGLALTLTSTYAQELQQNYFEGFLKFDYFDSTKNSFQVKTATDRAAPYDVVCDIKKDDENIWKSAKVRVFHSNSTFDQSGPSSSDFYFTGDGLVRNVTFEWTLFKERGPARSSRNWLNYSHRNPQNPYHKMANCLGKRAHVD